MVGGGGVEKGWLELVVRLRGLGIEKEAERVKGGDEGKGKGWKSYRRGGGSLKVATARKTSYLVFPPSPLISICALPFSRVIRMGWREGGSECWEGRYRGGGGSCFFVSSSCSLPLADGFENGNHEEIELFWQIPLLGYKLALTLVYEGSSKMYSYFQSATFTCKCIKCAILGQGYK